MGFGPLSPTSPPGMVEPDRLGSGSVNRPSPAPSLFPSRPRELWRTLNRRRHRPTFPVSSGGRRRRRLGQNSRPNSLYLLLQLESADASSPRRSVDGFPSVSAIAGRLLLDASPNLLQVLAVRPLVVVKCVCTPVMRCSSVPWWRLPWAASGRPRRHCPAMPSRQAPRRWWACLLPLYLSPSSPAMASGHLVKASEPSSQTLFCDAVSWC
jgi:hypothetical protein